MRVKKQKEMSLQQLIAWAMDNNATGIYYTKNRKDIRRVCFKFGRLTLLDRGLRSSDYFTVEVMEEITENTRLPKLLAIFKHNENTYSEIHLNKSINEILQLDSKVQYSNTKSVHIFEDDDSLTLFWKNGKLVE
ncbi:hypothetical protein [Mammaliicoccus sciuri]|uniref:hypothetical protein n=1 Tax=Mammaliicoccus sciuri TaxID=1296 RepID=UPI002B25D00A|nr:hypothetical protein [Mammaliicoccus sciuri]WQK75268.1 hypothetical protein P3U33_05920 [Mammaliicoccus sciuri]